MGCVVPAIVLFNPKTGKSIPWIIFASVLTVLGVVCERWLIVIPGQTHPPDLLPNMRIVESVLDEEIVYYTPSIHEVSQAVSVLAIIGFVFVLGLKFLKLMPTEAKVHQ